MEQDGFSNINYILLGNKFHGDLFQQSKVLCISVNLVKLLGVRFHCSLFQKGKVLCVGVNKMIGDGLKRKWVISALSDQQKISSKNEDGTS